MLLDLDGSFKVHTHFHVQYSTALNETKKYSSVDCEIINMAAWEHQCICCTLTGFTWPYCPFSSFFISQHGSGRPWAALTSRTSCRKTNNLHSSVGLCVAGWWTKQACPTRTSTPEGIELRGPRRREWETLLSPPALHAFGITHNAACCHCGLHTHCVYVLRSLYNQCLNHCPPLSSFHTMVSVFINKLELNEWKYKQTCVSHIVPVLFWMLLFKALCGKESRRWQ